MATPKVHKFVAIVATSKLTVPELIGKTTSVVTAMTGNKWFPSPNPTLAVLTTDNNALEAAQTLAVTKAKGAAADRNTKRAVVLSDLKRMASYVEGVADANPDDAQAIIESAGLSVKKTVTPKPKQDLALKPGTISGAVKVVAKSAGPRTSYDWEWSTDQKTWTPLPSTIQARTTIQGLTAGTTIYVRHRAVTKTGVTDWGQIVSTMVQ
jgi:hypothetical protein